MIDDTKVTQLLDLLPTTQSIIVALGPDPSLDYLVTALALTDALRGAGKEVHLVSPMDTNQIEATSVLNVDQIENQLGNRDLLVSFDYSPETVDKVSYHIDEQQGKFCLVIKPQKGQKPLDPQTVEYSYTGAEADLLFLVGVHDLETLGQLYFGYEPLYQNTTIVTLHSFEPEIGTIKIDTSGASCMAESVHQLLQWLNLAITPDSATNLLSAIEEATNHFQSLSASADTFEAVSALLKVGGRRVNRKVAPAVNGFRPQQTQLETIPRLQPHAQPSVPKKNKRPKATPDRPTAAATGSLQYQPSNLGGSTRN